ncbi:LysM peptidoglycan-binding domain-containing protein [Modestobacter sp. URMC 112]
MSLGRWTATSVVMAAVAWALAGLGPQSARAWAAVIAPQALVDAAGVDALLVPVAAAAGWACWAWGVLGLVLTALSALPGAVGRTADLLLMALLPAGARRLAAMAVGLTVGAGAPLSAVPAVPALDPGTAVLTAAADHRPAPDDLTSTTGAGIGGPVADWPAGRAEGPPVGAEGPSVGAEADEPDGGGPPDWPAPPTATPSSPAPAPAPSQAPAGPAADQHVVLRGDCLWDIAADRLAAQRPGAPVGDADVLAAVHAWWQANAGVIGPDPDLLLPGQVLSAPPLATPRPAAPR